MKFVFLFQSKLSQWPLVTNWTAFLIQEPLINTSLAIAMGTLELLDHLSSSKILKANGAARLLCLALPPYDGPQFVDLRLGVPPRYLSCVLTKLH